MDIGTYFVRVQVEGHFIPVYQYKDTSHAVIQVKS